MTIQRVFVTGGSGFLGSYVVRGLLAKNLDVVVLLRGDAFPERLKGLGDSLQIIRGTLDDPVSYRSALTAFAPDAVIHMAWVGVAGKDRNDPSQFNNILAMQDLVEAAHNAGAKHFIGAGSQAEYGPINKICSEDDATAPTTFYGKAKLEAGQQAASTCMKKHIRFAWLRIFSTYGAHDHEHWMLPYLITELLAGRSPDLTRGEQLWDYLHARDAAEAFASVLLNEQASGVFNLGSGEAQPLAKTIEFIRATINPALPLGFGKIPYADGQVMHLQADISRLKQKTGWKPAIPLAEGLRETIGWYKSR